MLLCAIFLIALNIAAKIRGGGKQMCGEPNLSGWEPKSVHLQLTNHTTSIRGFTLCNSGKLLHNSHGYCSSGWNSVLH